MTFNDEQRPRHMVVFQIAQTICVTPYETCIAKIFTGPRAGQCTRRIRLWRRDGERERESIHSLSYKRGQLRMYTKWQMAMARAGPSINEPYLPERDEVNEMGMLVKSYGAAAL
jgi:hypothetical protein